MARFVADEGELRRFTEWLREPEPTEGYLLQLMIRSKGLKERYGFKGSDHALKFEWVPGYKPLWREELVLKVKRLAVLAERSDELFVYVRHRPGTTEVEEVVRVPPPLVALFIHVNPSRWIKAAEATAKEIVESLTAALGTEEYWRVVRRPDRRFHANLARYQRRLFYQVDLDDRSLQGEVEAIILEALGFLPARILTPRGIHYLIPVGDFTPEQAMRWYGNRKKGIVGAQERLARLGEEHTGEKGEPLLEVKKHPLEPVPGTLYKGEYVVRFKPEER